MQNEELPTPSGGVSDLAGLGKAWASLINPIMHGVGKVFSPTLRKRENKAQIAMFDAWDEALKAKGYHGRTVELTLAERGDVKLLADSIVAQSNREAIASAAIEYAQSNEPIVDPSIPEPDADWLDRFWRVAQNVNTDEMQRFFGIVLARRASCQATVSARAIEFLSLLSGAEAQALERIASFALFTTEIGDVGGVLDSLPHVAMNDPDRERKQRASDALTMYVQPLKQGLFGSLGVFVETGWAHSFQYWKSGPGTREFRIAGRYFRVTGGQDHLTDGSLYIGTGVGLSPLGAELVGIINSPADDEYVRLLVGGLRLFGMQVEEVDRPSA